MTPEHPIKDENTGKTINGRDEIVLGENADGTLSTLPEYIETDEGVQVHPDRLVDYLERRAGIDE